MENICYWKSYKFYYNTIGVYTMEQKTKKILKIDVRGFNIKWF